MNRIFKFLVCAGAAVCFLAAAGATSRLSAQGQHRNCWQCIPNGPNYLCLNGYNLGYTSCTTFPTQGGCTLGGLCGYTLTLADGTVEVGSKPVSPGTDSIQRRPPESSSLVGSTAVARTVQRGCNGTIVGRDYVVATTLALRRASRVIRV